MDMAAGEFLWENRMDVRATVPWEMNMVGDVINEFIFYYPRSNTYTDGEGREIDNVFDIITPNDLEMFKSRPYRHTHFLHRDKKDTLIEMRHIGPSFAHNPELQMEIQLLRSERRRSS